MGAQLLEHLFGLQAGGYAFHRVLQHGLHHLQLQSVVVDHQYVEGQDGHGHPRLVLCRWYRDMEGGPLTHLALNGKRSLQQLYQLQGNGQSQAKSLLPLGILQSRELLEHSLLVGRRDPTSRI